MRYSTGGKGRDICLIALAYRAHPDFELMFAANRDEFHERPTRPADFWPDHPQLLAGVDERGGGTWMGVTRTGRFAALSNYREPAPQPQASHSRGALVRDFLAGAATAAIFAARAHASGNRYAGFNLLLKDHNDLYYLSNRESEPRRVPPGVYGLSNHLLDTSWPKVCRLRDAMAAQSKRTRPDADALFAALADTRPANDEDLPDTGVGPEVERLLSAPFIVSARYGTRSSTVLLMNLDGETRFEERTFDPEGALIDTRRYAFQVTPE